MKTREEALEYFRHQGGDYELDDNPDTGGFYFKYEVREPAGSETARLVLTFDHPDSDDGLFGFNYEYGYDLNDPQA